METMKETMTMKNFNRFFSIALLSILAVAACYGQASMATTTLGAAITSTNQTTITLASTSTMLSRGQVNQTDTVLYVDRELMWVTTVVDSTHVIVQRAKGIGAGARPTTHKNGETVYFAITTTTAPAASYFNTNSGPEDTGQCTASNLLVIPRINVYQGSKWDCLGVTTAGHWVRTDAPGVPVLGATYTVPAGTITLGGTIIITDSGTAQATGITVPGGWSPGMCVTFIPGGAFTTTTSGGLANIRLGTTAVAGKALIMCWDGTAWDPSY